MNQQIIHMLIVLTVIGAALYLFNRVVPAPAWLKAVVNVVGIVILVIQVLKWLGSML